MRKILLVTLIVALFSFSCRKQEKSVDKLFSEYEGQEGVSSIKLPPVLFMAYLKTYEDVPEFSFENVEIIRYMIVDRKKTEISDKPVLLNDILSELTELQFEDLMRYSDSGNETIVSILGQGEIISDLVVLVNNKESLMLIGISGQMKIEDITRLASEIDFNSLKGFELN